MAGNQNFLNLKKYQFKFLHKTRLHKDMCKAVHPRRTQSLQFRFRRDTLSLRSIAI